MRGIASTGAILAESLPIAKLDSANPLSASRLRNDTLRTVGIDSSRIALPR